MKEIDLMDGTKAKINDEHYEWLNCYDWTPYIQYRKDGQLKYAMTLINGTVIYMHRFIMKPDKGMVVHHKDGNGLNNQTDNLKIITQRENMLMRKMDKTSKYPGVIWDKRAGKWKAQIWIKNRIKYLGYFNEEWRAAKAYRYAFEKVEGKAPRECYQDE
jgi:hypothetical protein